MRENIFRVCISFYLDNKVIVKIVEETKIQFEGNRLHPLMDSNSTKKKKKRIIWYIFLSSLCQKMSVPCFQTIATPIWENILRKRIKKIQNDKI